MTSFATGLLTYLSLLTSLLNRTDVRDASASVKAIAAIGHLKLTDRDGLSEVGFVLELYNLVDHDILSNITTLATQVSETDNFKVF